MKMKISDLMSVKLNLYKHSYDMYMCGDITLGGWLGECSEKCRPMIEKIREVSLVDDEKSKSMKKQLLPLVSVTGYFDDRRLTGREKYYNPVIAIDIDSKDNPKAEDWEIVKSTFMMLPYVFYASLSARGNGVFLLVAWDTSKDFLKVWKNLERDFYNMGAKIDPACKDITRLRFISYDKNAMVKDGEVELYGNDDPIDGEYEICAQEKDYSFLGNDIKKSKNSYVDAELIVKAIYKLIEIGYHAKDYNEWLKDGFRIATLGESGRELFRMISRHSPSYRNDRDVDHKYDNCLKTTIYTTSSLSYYYKLLKSHFGDKWRDEVLK